MVMKKIILILSVLFVGCAVGPGDETPKPITKFYYFHVKSTGLCYSFSDVSINTDELETYRTPDEII